MGQAIRTTVELLRLRSGPQDMPQGVTLAAVLAAVYILQGFVADRILDEESTAPRNVLAIAVQFGAVAALLNARGLATRVTQTISALAGTGVLIGGIAIFLLTLVNPEQPQPELALAYLALFMWSLAVDAHIYRHALSTKMSYGVLLAVLIYLANFILLRAVFG